MTKSTITREPITHDLKIYPEFFSAVCAGVKRAELRKNDRDYRVGDTLHLMETPRGSCHQTGEFINVKITHIADVGEWIPGYVLLSIEREPPHSEPVAYIFKHPSGKLFWSLTDESNKGHDDVMPVYASPQPVPVVPDGYVMVPKEPTDEMLAAAKEWTGLTSTAEVVYIKMLAASPQPQNAPQNIPEIIPGWIPVSERMPEDRTQVILWDAEIGEVTSGHYSHKTHTFYHCGDAIENEITHWMAPPAAPQEVKGE
ncbi:DUF3850 domain-containing protein [Klebsiella pneumoniae]|uniref:DUF3850 domain-containing protein n=1 Tax=Klebsiella pneumoniae TaxID=573 RepID=UPI0010337523|nr:DUF3850 domain-containing protein [Klebsiella pneumoniae]